MYHLYIFVFSLWTAIKNFCLEQKININAALHILDIIFIPHLNIALLHSIFVVETRWTPGKLLNLQNSVECHFIL